MDNCEVLLVHIVHVFDNVVHDLLRDVHAVYQPQPPAGCGPHLLPSDDLDLVFRFRGHTPGKHPPTDVSDLVLPGL